MTARLAAAAFVLGTAVMLAFDSTAWRVAGVVLLFAGLGLGVFAIATPAFLERDEERH